MEIKCLSKSAGQTKKLGESLAKELLKEKEQKGAFVLGLEGDLGGGKTTFLQGFARGLGIKQKILSPTFIIMRKFEIRNSKFKYFYHIDCYRIQKVKEILDLGFKEILSRPENIVAVEWAEKISKILPKDILTLEFEFINKETREIVLKYQNGR
jgi:tRNA threonylcarbamoyladenosine biosynthesis protein TsaE